MQSLVWEKLQEIWNFSKTLRAPFSMDWLRLEVSGVYNELPADQNGHMCTTESANLTSFNVMGGDRYMRLVSQHSTGIHTATNTADLQTLGQEETQEQGKKIEMEVDAAVDVPDVNSRKHILCRLRTLINELAMHEFFRCSSGATIGAHGFGPWNGWRYIDWNAISLTAHGCGGGPGYPLQKEQQPFQVTHGWSVSKVRGRLWDAAGNQIEQKRWDDLTQFQRRCVTGITEGEPGWWNLEKIRWTCSKIWLLAGQINEKKFPQLKLGTFRRSARDLTQHSWPYSWKSSHESHVARLT